MYYPGVKTSRSVLLYTRYVKYLLVYSLNSSVNLVLTTKRNDGAIQVHSDALCPAL